MPMNQKNTRTFHRRLYAGQLQSIELLKREDDQREGVVRSYTLFQCRRSQIFRTGEPLVGEMVTTHRVTWHIPRCELIRIGIDYLNSLDRIVDHLESATYQPESTTSILAKLFSNMINIDCLRVS